MAHSCEFSRSVTICTRSQRSDLNFAARIAEILAAELEPRQMRDGMRGQDCEGEEVGCQEGRRGRIWRNTYEPLGNLCCDYTLLYSQKYEFWGY